jgi:hypothetical protein
VTQLLQSLQSTALQNSFSSDRINKDLLLQSLSSANNPTGTSQAVSDTLALNLASDFQFRQALAANLTAQGISNGATLAGQSAIAVTGNNPLTSPVAGDFLTKEQLAEQIVTELTKKIGNSVNPALANSLATQFALAVVGPTTPSSTTSPTPTPTEIATDEIKRPTSILNLMAAAYQDLLNSQITAQAAQSADAFKDTLKPSNDLFTLAQRINDPAWNLILTSASSISYSHNPHSKQSIDILG